MQLRAGISPKASLISVGSAVEAVETLSKQDSMSMTEQDATIKELREKLATSEQHLHKLQYKYDMANYDDLQNRDRFLKHINRAQEALRESDGQMDCLRKRLASPEQEKEIYTQKLSNIGTELVNELKQRDAAAQVEIKALNERIQSLIQGRDALKTSEKIGKVDSKVDPAPGNAEQLALINKLQGKLDLLERMALGRKRAIEVAALESVERARLTHENQAVGYKFDEASALNEFLNQQLKVYKSGEDMRELQKEYDTYRSTSLLNLARSKESLTKSKDSVGKSEDSVVKSNESMGTSDDSAIGSAEDVSKKQKKIDQKAAKKARKEEEKAAKKSAKSLKDFTPIPAN
jgi:hypothetical protein